MRELDDDVYFHNYCLKHKEKSAFVVTNENHKYKTREASTKSSGSATSPKNRSVRCKFSRGRQLAPGTPFINGINRSAISSGSASAAKSLSDNGFL